MLEIGITLEPDDTIFRIRGVGGSEFVFAKQVEHLQVGPLGVEGYTIEVGGLAYGLELDGILGLDFLLQEGAHIDLRRLEISAG